MTPRPTLPIGTSDFRRIREDGRLYVDKTALISQVLDDPAEVLLLPRPRRFGKTTNLSMLRYFLEKRPEDLSPLFADLAIWRTAGARQHCQRYPVIYLTFKDIKKDSFPQCLAAMAETLSALHREHRYLLQGDLLTPEEAEIFTAILRQEASQVQYEASLRRLSRYLYQHHQARVVILIDEYDTPLHAAFLHRYFDTALSFFRGLLSGGLKDNQFLFKGMLTGILRVARETIFSDLNNLSVYTLLHPRFAPFFGFTEDEVRDLAGRAGFPGRLDELRDWYNGYLFGETVIYNPWSVLCAMDRGTCAPYWVNTSSNDLIQQLLLRASSEAHLEMEALLQGASIHKKIVENTVLREIYHEEEALWSFLLFSGYLKAGAVQMEEDGALVADLSIPNRELRWLFTDRISRWLKAGLGGERQVAALAQALLTGDAAACEQHLSRLLQSASYLDLGGEQNKLPPEQLYHVFVLGLLLYLQPRYLVRSNRESGQGRSDVMIIPRQPGQAGVVLELKVRRKGQTLAQALSAGLRQLKAEDYAAELRAQGASEVHELAVALDGKRARVSARTPASRR